MVTVAIPLTCLIASSDFSVLSLKGLACIDEQKVSALISISTTNFIRRPKEMINIITALFRRPHKAHGHAEHRKYKLRHSPRLHHKIMGYRHYLFGFLQKHLKYQRKF